MARLARVSPVGVPVHIIQRGNNRQVCFANESDYKAYLHWLKMYANKYDVSVHAWVLMTNHVHLLCTPNSENALSLMMQALGRQYVQYFNRQYQRSGTLWEGRFRSCLIESEGYFLAASRYIELNPVRAGMVSAPEDYPWSSYKVNALGHESELGSASVVYESLGDDRASRALSYKALFDDKLHEVFLTEIREATNRGLALGSDRFKEEIAVLTGRRVTVAKQGRPPLKQN